MTTTQGKDVEKRSFGISDTKGFDIRIGGHGIIFIPTKNHPQKYVYKFAGSSEIKKETQTFDIIKKITSYIKIMNIYDVINVDPNDLINLHKDLANDKYKSRIGDKFKKYTSFSMLKMDNMDNIVYSISAALSSQEIMNDGTTQTVKYYHVNGNPCIQPTNIQEPNLLSARWLFEYVHFEYVCWKYLNIHTILDNKTDNLGVILEQEYAIYRIGDSIFVVPPGASYRRIDLGGIFANEEYTGKELTTKKIFDFEYHLYVQASSNKTFIRLPYYKYISEHYTLNQTLFDTNDNCIQAMFTDVKRNGLDFMNYETNMKKYFSPFLKFSHKKVPEICKSHFQTKNKNDTIKFLEELPNLIKNI